MSPNSSAEEKTERRVEEFRNEPSTPEHSILIPQGPIIVWGENKEFSKRNLVRNLCIHEPHMARGTDRRCMEEYLTKVAIDGLQDVGVGEWEDFLPIGVPLIDLYSLVVQDEASWKFPSQDYLTGCLRTWKSKKL